MNKKFWLGSALFLVFFSSVFYSNLWADSQFRIAILDKNADVVLQGKPSATVGIDAFLQEGLLFLNKNRVVFSQNQNVTWRTFLQANGVKVRPGSDRYALRSDRYYQFSHITITAIKPRQTGFVIPWEMIKDIAAAGVLVVLGIGSLIYLFRSAKPESKPKIKSKSKNKAKTISISKKTTRKALKKKMIKKKVKKTSPQRVKKAPQKSVKKKVTRKKVKTLKTSQTKKKSKPKKKKVLSSGSSTFAESSASQSPMTFKKSKSILIKPTAKRIKNIKLARQLALKSTPQKNLTLNDFIQEDIANNPSVMLNPPTKTELRTNSPDDL